MIANTFLLGVEAVFFFVFMVGLLHFRVQIGLGVFICALGATHFLDTYLTTVFYVQTPFGIISPGSTVFLVAKLMLLLLLYVKEDAATVRQPIYGLLAGNVLILFLAVILRLHLTADMASGLSADLGFLDEIGILMIWRTLLLYVESVGIILLYERLGALGIASRTLRFFLAVVVVLAFDQTGFYIALSLMYGASANVFFGGLTAKITAAAIYAAMVHVYFRLDTSFQPTRQPRRIGEIFSDLTFRDHYESLFLSASRDSLTGAWSRGRFDRNVQKLLEEVSETGRRSCIAVIDIDHFKTINDRFGHAAGDAILKRFADVVRFSLGRDAYFYRYRSEEFVIACIDHDRSSASALLNAILMRVSTNVRTPSGEDVTFSAGVAEYGRDGTDLAALMSVSDMRLYAAKQSGRNRVY
jgi:diguanylate cyclase (GGDEF)-like protein